MKIALVVVAAFSLLLSGCRAKPPGKFETSSVNWAKHHITVGGRKTQNPFKPTTENIADGKQAFTSYCMVCHVLDGQNTGVPFASRVSPPVPSLASPEIQSYTDGQLKWIIENGLFPSGMPPSAGTFNDDDMWKMVLYIRHLPPKGSLGEPKVYSGE
jgi:mono/diheme cytochrome c family protein